MYLAQKKPKFSPAYQDIIDSLCFSLFVALFHFYFYFIYHLELEYYTHISRVNSKSFSRYGEFSIENINREFYVQVSKYVNIDKRFMLPIMLKLRSI